MRFVEGRPTVFGMGSSDARIMFVGEQPGIRRLGRFTFVGPVGSFSIALDEAGVWWNRVYVTNAVKHLFEPRDEADTPKPSEQEIEACRR
jgi:DNA polymerase